MAEQKWFEDFPVGYRYETSSVTLSEAEIIDFARLHDPQFFHVDPDAAADGPFGGLIASGFQTMTVAFGLTLREGGWEGASMGSPGMAEVKWLRPVRPGARLHVRAEVVAARVSRSKPDRGFVEKRYEVLDAAGEVVMSYLSTHILRCCPA